MEGNKVSIELPAESWNFILNVLGDLPFKQTAGLIFEIKNQAESKLPAAQAPVATEE